MYSTMDRIHIGLAAILVVLAMAALLHLAALDATPPEPTPTAEPSFPVLQRYQPAAVETPPPRASPSPEPTDTLTPPQWDWSVDGHTLALDPETGQPAIPDEWYETGCGCTDPALAGWQPFTYRPEIPLAEDLQCILWDVCQQYGIPYEIGLGLIETESGFDPNADNGICRGLCQLHRAYWPEVLPPGENIEEGMRLLAQHYQTYQNWPAALTAYNAGHDTGDRTYTSAVLRRAEQWAQNLKT